MTAEREGAEVAAVLAAHFTGSDPRTHESTCTCGWRGPFRLGDWAGALADKTAHIAEALAPLMVERERLAAERALRLAADAALTMFDPPVGECIEWSEWLRARAEHSDRADTYAQGGERP